jgi:hypothetical protein
MELLNIVENEHKGSTFDNFLTFNRKFLYLSYLPLNNGSDTQSYNEFFDQLDLTEQTYNKVEKLYMETDFITFIPENVKKFRNLIKLTVTGGAFCDLNMQQVPNTIKKLYLTEHGNLQSDCLLGITELINLKTLILDFRTFKLCHLFVDQYWEFDEEITFGFSDHEKRKENLIALLRCNPLFGQISERIETITKVCSDSTERVKIKLKSK